MRSSKKRVESNPHVFSQSTCITPESITMQTIRKQGMGEGGMYMEEALNYLKDIGIVKWGL